MLGFFTQKADELDEVKTEMIRKYSSEELIKRVMVRKWTKGPEIEEYFCLVEDFNKCKKMSHIATICSRLDRMLIRDFGLTQINFDLKGGAQ